MQTCGAGGGNARACEEESPDQVDTDTCLCVVHLCGATKSCRGTKNTPQGVKKTTTWWLIPSASLGGANKVMGVPHIPFLGRTKMLSGWGRKARTLEEPKQTHRGHRMAYGRTQKCYRERVTITKSRNGEKWGGRAPKKIGKLRENKLSITKHASILWGLGGGAKTLNVYTTYTTTQHTCIQ